MSGLSYVPTGLLASPETLQQYHYHGAYLYVDLMDYEISGADPHGLIAAPGHVLHLTLLLRHAGPNGLSYVVECPQAPLLQFLYQEKELQSEWAITCGGEFVCKVCDGEELTDDEISDWVLGYFRDAIPIAWSEN